MIWRNDSVSGVAIGELGAEKSAGGSKIMSSLSSIPFSNPGRLDRISALEFAFPGMWWSVK